jgi:CPA2 family monovalent cation:H+ antiporter-2
MVVERVRGVNPGVHIVARSSSAEQLQDFGKLGIYEAVQPEFEAALELGRQALVHLDIEAGEIQRFSDQVRGELYAPIVGGSDDGMLDQLRRATRMIETEWIRLPQKSPVFGKSIGELHIRNTVGASIVAVVRDDDVIASPGPEVTFQSGDTAVVLGSREQRGAFREMIEGRAVGAASGGAEEDAKDPR